MMKVDLLHSRPEFAGAGLRVRPERKMAAGGRLQERATTWGRLYQNLILILGVLILTALLVSAANAATLKLYADPPRIRADGRSTAVIIAQVQNNNGSPAADGVQVSFTTSLGAITSLAETHTGVARAILTSGSAAGVAIVSAQVAEARQETEVEFVSEGGAAQGAAGVMQLEGKELSYSQQGGAAIIRQDGRFKYGTLTIRAVSMQCEVQSASVSAQGAVEVSDGKQAITGDALVYLARWGQGSLLRYEENQPLIYTFTLPAMKLVRDEKADLNKFRPLPERASRTFISAKRMLVLPDRQMVFDAATILVDGVKLLSLPHYVLSSGGSEREILEQAISFNGGAGLTANFPFYFAAKPGQIGSLRLTHGPAPGAASGQEGWGLGLEEQYLLGDRGRGKLNIDDLLSDSRGLRWTHTQEFADSLRSFSSVRYTRFDSYAPRVFDASSTLSKTLPGLSLDLALHASTYADTRNYTAWLSARTLSKRIGKSGFAYATSLRLGYTLSPAYELAHTSETGSIAVLNSGLRPNLTQTISFQLNSPQVKLGQKFTFDSGLALGNTWSSNGLGQSLSLNANLRRPLGESGSLGIGYNAIIASASKAPSTSYRRPRSQGISCNLNAGKTGKWQVFGFASYQVEMASLFGSGNLVYYLPYQQTEEGNPIWALRLSGAVSKWGQSRSTDMSMSLARTFGNWDLSLNYSPQGNYFQSGLGLGSTGLLGMSSCGYTQNLGRTFWIEISPQSLF